MHQVQSSRFARRGAGALGVLLAMVLFVTAAFSVQFTLAQDENSIVGQYAVAIVRGDVPTDLPDGYNYVGKWIIDFNDDGTYTARRQDVGLLVSGSWEASGDVVTITDDVGLVSCTNPTAVTIPGDDITAGSYTWSRNGDNLQLIPQEDGCGGRVLLLSTHILGPYVPCTVDPIDLSDEAVDETGDVLPVGSPEAIVAEVLTPDDPGGSTRGGSTGSSQSTQDATAEPELDAAAVAAEIDTLLGQMTSCWSTGDPDLWMALLSAEFRELLIGSDPDFLTTIQAAMAVPIIWERAGAVEVESPTTASAIVRTTVDQEQDFQRFAFVLEDGEWRWDG
ncbi:MAG: hypothetical protein IT335_08325 [Thermomicrobiales bacterium]|nr:hypothetical protein [Thermomicrobiales bacterium]